MKTSEIKNAEIKNAVKTTNTKKRKTLYPTRKWDRNFCWLIDKMDNLAELVKNEFISEYRDSYNGAEIVDILARDGYVPFGEYELEITEYYRNDCDPCSHFTDAQTEFNNAKLNQLLRDFQREYPHLDSRSDEFAEWESEAFDPAQLCVIITWAAGVVTICCCVAYGRTAQYSGCALIDVLFEFQPDLLHTNENILEQMRGLMNANSKIR